MLCQSIPLYDRDKFKADMREYSAPKLEKNYNLDRYLAMSVVQKSIRRGELGLALTSGGYLLENFPQVFWKRLQIIALEDVGLANPALVEQVIDVASDTPSLVGCGGLEKVAAFLMEKLCFSQKDRSTDDLFDVMSRDPICANNCTTLIESRENGDLYVLDGDVFGRVLSIIPPGQREIVWDSYLRRADEWMMMMEGVEFNAPASIIALSSKASRRTRSMLAPMLLALSPEFPVSVQEADDFFLPEESYKGVPTWACGMHTRVGLAGLRQYAKHSPRVGKLLKQGKTGEVSTSKVLGGLLFRMECGQLQKRVDWFLGRSLKDRATELGWGVSDECVPDLLCTMKEEWNLLNACRLSALQDYLR
ncbi:hypothetical protein [Shimia thalassica]|uniref:hypothetical protein n=1 Tax=Shimia thalassica TaxID=1715693 RepID=UPI0026E23AE5|nr:hypothetical protein [Shimia thalassica]MDO6481908.1 hypothetical protein [Shimia thalassica]